MATVKNTNSDYVITCDNGSGNLVINANTEVFGNLGTAAAFTVVAANNMGAMEAMGLLARTSFNSWAGLRFNTIMNRWEVSNSVTDDGAPVSDYVPIGIGSDYAPGGSNLSVQFNYDGGFAGINALTLNPVTNSLQLDGYQCFSIQTSDPAAIANTVTMFANVPAAGNSGLFLTDTRGPTNELITANQSLLYSIIF